LTLQLTEQSWRAVKNTTNVIGFIGGSSGKPSPITQREVDKIMARVQEGTDKPKPKVAYQPGEEILVIDGPFNEFNGTVESVDYEKNLLVFFCPSLSYSTCSVRIITSLSKSVKFSLSIDSSIATFTFAS
jgi:transcription antitermination factor NusG